MSSSLDFTLAIVNISEYLDIFCQSIFMNKNLFCWSEGVSNMCNYLVGKLSKEKTIAVQHIGSLGLSVEVVGHMLNAQPEVYLYPGLPAGKKSIHFVCFP